MIKNALEYLVNLGQIKVLEVENQAYATKQLHHIRLPKVESLQVNSLSGFVDYINSRFDKDYFAGNLVHVVSHKEVGLISNLLKDAGRETYITAHAFQAGFNFGRFYGLEPFIIAMQSCFVRNDDAMAILRVIGNIKEESVRQVGDDGITQSVTARAGIAMVEEVTVPNPVKLAPYRTFMEIEQPESEFVFRMRSGDHGPECALFEADGGAWKLEAMARVKDYLIEQLKGTGIKVIA